MKPDYAISTFFKDSRRGSPLLFWSAVAMLFSAAVCIVLLFVDHRQFNGVGVWEKPAKFFVSLVVLGISVGWSLSLLKVKARGVSTATKILFFAGWLEVAYIVFRAARGEGSHFNTGTPIAAILYSIMGVGALSLTVFSGFIGWRVWQNRDGNLMREAAGLGLMLGAVLATLTAGYLSSLQGHWIGGDQTDATGLGFFHWSTTGGDLRVSHFIGLHVMQALPLSALSGKRYLVYGVAVLCILATATTFVMAINGVPLLRA
jgi:hypothetical protein